MKPSRKLENKEAKKIEFSPEKSYTWKVDDQFAISGQELDTLNKVFNILGKDPEIQKALAVVEGMKVISNIISDSVEEGLILEAPAAEAKGVPASEEATEKKEA